MYVMLGYGCNMTNTIKLLKERQNKAQTKVARYEKTLETAKNELSDINTTLRILGEIEGVSDSESDKKSVTSVGERQNNLLFLIADGQDRATQPAEIYETYKVLYGEEINIDTFRTTIWRMKGKTFLHEGKKWRVHSNNGHYWKVEITTIDNETSVKNIILDEPNHYNNNTSQHHDLEDDVPF